MKGLSKIMSVLLIASAFFGVYSGAVNVQDVLSSKDFWEEKGKEANESLDKLEDGISQLGENEQAYVDGVDAVADGEKELASGKAELAAGRIKLAAGESELTAGKAKVAAGEKELTAGKAKVAAGEKELATGKATLAEKKAASQEAYVAANAMVDATDTEKAIDFVVANSKGKLDKTTATKLYTVMNALIQGADLPTAAGIVANSQLKEGEDLAAKTTEIVELYNAAKAYGSDAVAGNKANELVSSVVSVMNKFESDDEGASYIASKNSSVTKEQVLQIWTAYNTKKKSAEAAGATEDQASATAIKGVASSDAVKAPIKENIDLAVDTINQAQGAKGDPSKAADFVVSHNKGVEKKDVLTAYGTITALPGVDTLPKAYNMIVQSKKNEDPSSTITAKDVEDGYNAYAAYLKGAGPLADAEKKIAAGEKELAKGKSDVAAGEKELAAGKAKVAAGEKELAKGRSDLADGEAKIADGEQELADGKAKLAQYEDGEAQLIDGLNTLLGSETYGDLKSIADRLGKGFSFMKDNGKNVDLAKATTAAKAGRSFLADTEEAVTDELMPKAYGDIALIVAAVLALIGGAFGFSRKKKLAGACAALAAVAGGIGAYLVSSVGSTMSEVAGSTASSPVAAAVILAGVAIVAAIVNFMVKKDA